MRVFLRKELEFTERIQMNSPVELGKVSTLVEVLCCRAREQPGDRGYTYLLDGEAEADSLTYAELDRQARSIAVVLQSFGARGERALLLYPTGVEFIAAFFGCLYAGATAVPLSPPHPAQPQRTLPRLRAIAENAQPSIVLTTSSILCKVKGLFTQAQELSTIHWVATDKVPGALAPEWKEPGVSTETLALLQYTSGSTTTPKGVMVSHGNLLYNSACVNQLFDPTPYGVTVTWLPAFHDMGLTNGIIQPVYKGRPCFMMSPQSFLQRPIRWLQAISRYKATVSGGPNFAYEQCITKTTPQQRETLDLSSWDVAYNGAEPIRGDTLERFATTFASCGFRPGVFHPCYGLAEATLLVSGGSLKDGKPCHAQAAALEHNRVAETSDPKDNVRTLVGSGRTILETRIVVVDPESLTACAADTVGEIWVSGPGVTKGYWHQPEETERSYRAYLADNGDGPFLRTGDLGFLKDGELFITGRLKDLIIIAGRNIYPHDIELTVEQSYLAIRPGGCAAFSINVADEDRLVIAAEIERCYQSVDQRQETGTANNIKPRYENGAARNGAIYLHSNGNGRLPLNAEAITRAIRQAVAEEHDVRVHAAVLLKAGSLPKTSSGKVQRNVCQANFLNGTLATLQESV
jgi:acyl-CoA synthetase (AMP-forming)/AMP-acid ligase II